ncbi:MAG: RluA family pseudouridine synthase [Lachnoclostridium sp.]|nr:RluA family pseudouridine synthase [Lachnoclostridium sp.]
MKEIIISENEAGQRLDKLLGKYLNEAPKSFFYKMLRKKNIVLNDKKASGNEKLKMGDHVKLYLADDTIQKFSSGYTEKSSLPALAKAKKQLDIIYEDHHILLINKPSGMLSQKAAITDVSAVEYVIQYLLDSGQMTEEELSTFRPGVCNRLDRNTSGILAAGKTLAGLQELSRIFKDRSLHKYYRCLVKGSIKEGQHICGYLVKDEKTNRVIVSKHPIKDSLPIETSYQPVSGNDRVTLLEVHLITGRTHQIRAHLASIGHPIIGDYKYGDRKINQYYKEKYGLTSQLLHAYRLEFPQMSGVLKAVSGMCVTAPLPALFTKILEKEG